jgi:transcriptional regulator with XRE-family HTH domain
MLEKILDYKQKSGLTQKQLASLLCVSPWTLNRWIKRRSGISMAYQMIVAKKLKIKIDKPQ